MKILGVDIGGTFTDIYLVDNDARTQSIHKVSTTPDDPSRGALRGIREICEQTGTDPGDIPYVLHGTTIATNAVLEHEGVETGLITTENYRDVLHIGRHQRPQNYSIQQRIPWQDQPLVERRHRIGVPERLTADGDVAVPLDESAVRAAARDLNADGVDAIAVCFLYSYLNDDHERRAKAIVEDEHPDAFVTTSSEVYPQFREFERFTTTAMNAFIGPPTVDYLDRFQRKLADTGIDADLHIMQSNGGIGTEEMIRDIPVSLLLSGPAAGILGGTWRTEINTPSDRENNAITLDMGGTSADIGILDRGTLAEANVRETQIGGYPVMSPMLDIETIGAGGGSIGYVDPGGAFRVGPRSAGAQPGPVAYDRGGHEPTVTDAHVTLGRIREEFFLGGEMGLAPEAARTAVAEQLGDALGLSPVEASLGLLDIVNNNMANAIRSKTIQQGRDPENFTLVAFGGAGPMHAADVARVLKIPRVLIPTNPGVLSAVGLSTTDLQYDFVNTQFQMLSEADMAALGEEYAGLVETATARLRADGLPDDRISLELTADIRYEGQGYELNVDVGSAGELHDRETIRAAFDREHELEFGHNFPENEAELVNIRVTGIGAFPSSELVTLPAATTPVADHVLYTDEVYFKLGDDPTGYETRFLRRDDLRAGHTVDGPAVVGEKDATTIIPPDYRATVTEYGDLELVRGDDQ